MSKLTDRVNKIRESQQNKGTFEINLQEPTYTPLNWTQPQQKVYYRNGEESTQNTLSRETPVSAEWDLLNILQQSAEAPVDDTILTQIDTELQDIYAKLDIIDFLRKMEKSLKKRAKVLESLRDRVQEVRDELLEVGADSLNVLTTEEITAAKNYMSGNSPVIEKQKKPVKLNTETRLNDFALEE